MAKKQFNSVDGYSVGNANVVIDSNGNISGNAITATANITAPQIISNVATGTAPLVVSSTTQVANLNAATAGTAISATNAAALLQNTSTATTVYPMFTASSANGNSSAVFNTSIVANLSNASISATTFVGRLVGNVANGTSTISIPATNGNINLSSAGNANILVVTGTGANITGTANVTGNLAAGNISANIANLTTANITGNLTAGNITTGSGSGGNISGANVITANTFTGNLSNGNSSISIPAANGNINLNAGGNATAELIITTTGVNVNGTLNATGNANVGNLGTAGLITATGNVSGGNLTTGGALSVTGNANVGNIGAATAVISTGNITTINSGLVQNGNSNVTIAANGNVSVFVTGNATARAVFTSTGANIAGTANITGNANVGNLGTAQVLATANITAPQLISNIATGTAPFVVTSTTQVANLSVATAGSATTAGTVTTNAQPNITSVGTLSSLAVTANITAGNVYANSGTLGANTLTIANTASIGANLNMNSKNINNLADPVAAQDAASKAYVDSIAQGLDPKASVSYATATTLPAYTYNNGTSGVGATITGSSTGALSIDGTAVAANQRVLVKNETSTNAPYNGIYVVTNAGSAGAAYVLTRATDMDAWTEVPGAFVFVEGGATLADTGWVCTSDAGGTIGTTAITFVQFAGAGSYTAGTGLTLSGTQFSITDTTVTSGSYGNGDRVASFTVNSQGQLTAASNIAITANAANLTGTILASTIVTSSLTSVGTLGTLSVTGNANVGNIGATLGVFTNIAGEGGNISNIQGSNVSGTVSSATTAGTVTTAAQPNITSVGTLTSLSVTGNASAGNLNTAGAVVASTLTTNVATGTAPLTVTSTTRVSNLNVAYANVADFINVTAPGTGTGYLVFANSTTGNVAEWTSSGISSNLANNSITATTFVGALSGAATSATNASAVLNNVITTGTVYPTFISSTANGNYALTSNTVYTANVANGFLGATLLGGTLTTAAQPNITSTGTLTLPGLTANSATGRVSLATDAGGSISMGRVDGTTSIPYIDFNTSATAVDYDARIQASGNTGTIGGGTLTFSAASANFTGTINGNGSGLSAIAGGNVTGTVANATAAATVAVASQSANANTFYLTFVSGTSGGTALGLDSALSYVPSTDTLTVTNITGTASNATAAATVAIASQSANASTFYPVLAPGTSSGASLGLDSAFSYVPSTDTLSVGTVSASGNVSAANVVSTTNHIFSVATGISAAGSTQGTATSITKDFNVVSTVAASTGVILPAIAGVRMTVINNGANPLAVYPPSTGAINSQAANAAYSMSVGARLDFISVTTLQWYTLNATYG